MDLMPFVSLVFDMLQSIVQVLTNVSFKVGSVSVNPFALSVAMIIIYMVVYSYWKGARA